MRPVLLTATAWLAFLPSMHAQLPQVDDARLGVDALRLISGIRLYGFVLQENADRSLRFAVERKWLAATHAELYERQVAQEAADLKAAQEQLSLRLKQWIADRADDPESLLYRFLTSQLQRLDQPPTEDRNPRDRRAEKPRQFMVLHVERDDVREVKAARPDSRKIAGLAYQHGLQRVVETPATLLRKRLEEQQIDWADETVDLSEQVPHVQQDTPRQWAARRALIEYNMRESLDYQGTGRMLVRVGEGAANPAALMGQFLGGGMDPISQLGAELGLPEFKRPAESQSDWWRSATQAAERDGFHGVLITRLKQSLLSPQVVVETWFFARSKPDDWFPVVRLRSQANANNQAQERIDRIREDPQIKSLLDTLSSLGLDAGGRLDQALRHGAATQQAMRDANSRFYEFLTPYLDSVQSPPIELPSMQ